ncbi:acyl-CoA dehydrogenase family protein [Cupriavidus basilensis]
MRAERGRDQDGEHHVLNGSKRSGPRTRSGPTGCSASGTHRSRDAHAARTADLLRAGGHAHARHHRGAAAHAGRPGRQGQQEVNQVFFENVRVPVENRIGEEGLGWTYAKYLLEFERGGSYGPMLRQQLAKAARIAAKRTRRRWRPPARRSRLPPQTGLSSHVRAAALEASELRLFSSVASGTSIGAASSMLKLAGTETIQAISEPAVEAAGSYALPFVQDGWAEQQGRPAGSHIGPDYAAHRSARAYASTIARHLIYAGSNEIQRNIIAKLVLGL